MVRRVVPILEPAPIYMVGQEDPRRSYARSGQVGDGRARTDHQVHAFTQSRHADEIRRRRLIIAASGMLRRWSFK